MKNKILLLLTIIPVIAMINCMTKPVLEPFATIHLLDLPRAMEIQEKTVGYDFSIPENQAILKSGWITDPGAIRPAVANPVIALEFAEIRDRIIRFTIESPGPVTLTGKAGVNALVPNTDRENPPANEYELVYPAVYQKTGKNTVLLDIRPFDTCRLRTITILEGAGRVAFSAVGEDIRQSLIVLPDATVTFTVNCPQPSALLEMEMGIDDRARMMGSDGGSVGIEIRSGDAVQQIETMSVQPTGQWQPFRIPMETRFAGKETSITFTFKSRPGNDTISDIIAVADPRISAVEPPAKLSTDLPSVILITLDACRADRLGFGGDDIIRTPCLDSFTRMGHDFTDCICQINNTPPSHYTILTSKRPHTHGVYDMVTPLNPIHPTLARLLKPVGYRSAAATSAAWLSAITHGLGPGFERFYAPASAQRRCPVTYDALEPWLEERAKTSDEQPFFTWMHLFDAHTPLDPPSPYDRFYYYGDPKDPENHSLDNIGFAPEQTAYMKSWMKDFTDMDWFKAQYRSEISHMDHILEKMRIMLARTGAEKNTWIVITADHGISLDEHDLYFIMAGMYEQQMHIPLLIIPPRGAGGTGIYNTTVQSLDIAPTIMAITGQTIPPDFEGRNLLPLMNGGSVSTLPYVIAEHANNRAIMVRDSQHKYVQYIRSPYYHEPEFGVYDRNEDARENANLYGTLPDIESQMDHLLTQFRQKPVGETDAGAADSEQLRKKLEALGYVE